MDCSTFRYRASTRGTWTFPPNLVRVVVVPDTVPHTSTMSPSER